MKKLFGRDKAKVVKVTPGIRDDVSVLGENDTPPASRHDRIHSNPEDAWDMVSEADPPLHPLRHAPSQQSSYTSINHVGSPNPSPLPRPSSPFASNGLPPPQNTVKSNQTKDQGTVLRKKTPAAPNAFAAVGILNSLNPSHLEPVDSREQSDDGFTDSSHREDKEKREKRPFWERSNNKERDREKDRAREHERERQHLYTREKERERDRREDGVPAELTRLLGYLFATSSEDWSLVLEVCDRVSTSEENAKEAAKALRREFKGGEPSTQLSAARLWAIMLRNCSLSFVKQCTSRKFLDALEEVLKAKTTTPVVRERLIAVLAAASYASDSESGFRHLWRKVKREDQPDEGVPFDTDDAMFYPVTPRHSVGPNSLQPPILDPQPQPQHPHSLQPGHPQALQRNPSQLPQQPPTLHQPQPQRPPATVTSSKPRSRNRVIPPEEDIRRLFQECKVGRGNANLLSEALTYAKPEDLRSKDIIKEFYARCRASQELISAQIPWAFAQAERSREALLSKGGANPKPPKEGRHSIDQDRPPSSPKKDKEEHQTTEEKLLAAILASNEELLEALRLYDDLERVGIERDTEERSKRDVRMDRTRLHVDEENNLQYLEPTENLIGGSSSSRAPSPPPSTSPSPAPSLVITSAHGHGSSHAAPVPSQPAPGRAPHPVQHTSSQGSVLSLAPPPPAPHGPRLPQQRSNTPSPERGQLNHVGRASMESTTARQPSNLRHDSSSEPSDADLDECKTPVRPSAKALGKRRVVEPPEGERAFDPDDLFYEQGQNPNNNGVQHSDDSESDDGKAKGPWHRPVHYVYDAAAERTQQRIREGRLAAAALVGGVH
ncbi:uncharacterized protein BXZ73DRAFT_104144 [Epithele typhae]|uniref:uncharacterized protein n=1 Tax=Epithele typhae TaxID=378194 RepID=UPI0020085EF8|nr:uncharacterized protein BXZ73DRAFT_104144 [Epithele typhae]KAH9922326.1 hypothetical protein BXZ73DRAFT_104144 [Epithele typhae]